ncbi:MAG: hypothetical protein KGZ89_02845 [Actinobacteria bacterium]|nr:hypothetical protein [Actinomycetota bacterium]
MAKTTTCLLVMALTVVLTFGAPLALSAESGHGSEVTISVTVNPKISATFTSEGVRVRSNTAWRMEVLGANGSQPKTISGGPTAGQFVPLPPDSTVLSLVHDG